MPSRVKPRPMVRRIKKPTVLPMRSFAITGVILILLVVAIPFAVKKLDLFSAGKRYQVDSRLEEYYRLHGGESVFGAPISRLSVDAQSGAMAQYFENARLELDQDESGSTVVKASALGVMANGWEPPLAKTVADPGCELFPETGHQVCHAFLEFFRASGGADVFGYPISEIKVEAGQTVQYFQSFRLDWVSTQEGEGEVHPGPLGKILLESTSLSAEITQTPLPDVGEWIPSIYVEHAVMPPTGEQVVYLHVVDQSQQPLAGASATLEVDFGTVERTFIFPLTDEQGLSRVQVPFEDIPSGTTIHLNVSVIYAGQTNSTRDSFLVFGSNS